jgi:hypothetical protein
MYVSIRPYVSSGIALVAIGAGVAAPSAPQPHPRADETHPAVILAADVRPLVSPIPALGPQRLPSPTGQVAFHIDLAVDYVVKGAELVGRQIPVPGTLLRDLRDGVPLPAAVTRALTTLALVEVDAGRELVGYATRYVDFQLRFAADVVQGAVVLAAALPAAVTELVTSTVAPVAPVREPAPLALRSAMGQAPVDSLSDDDLIRRGVRGAGADADDTVKADNTDVDDIEAADDDSDADESVTGTSERDVTARASDDRFDEADTVAAREPAADDAGPEDTNGQPSPGGPPSTTGDDDSSSETDSATE